MASQMWSALVGGREALHYLSVTIADSFLRSHGLERYMRLCQCPPSPFAAVRAKFQGEFLDSSVDIDVDRLALLCSCVHGLIVSDDITGRLASAAAPQFVPGVPVGGVFGNSDARRQWVSMSATLSPDDLSVVRQEISRYDSGCDFQRMPTSESPTVSADPRRVLGDTSDNLPVGGVLANPDVRRQWASKFATLSPLELSVVRQELIRYDSGCDFRCLSNSELPTSIPSPETLFGCPGGILVWNGEDRLDGPIWTGVGLVTEVTLTFGNMGVEKRMWDCALQVESVWEWVCRADTQETWVLGHTAAQVASLPDGAFMSHSHETHPSAAASLGEALNVGGSVLQTGRHWGRGRGRHDLV